VTESPYSSRLEASVGAASPALRWLTAARDLGHPEACDFLAGNPQEAALPEYVAALRRAAQPDRPSYYAYGPPWTPAITAVSRALSERLDLWLDPQDVFLTRGASSGLGVVLRVLLEAGDEVLMMSPPWFFYESFALAEGAVPVKVPLLGDSFDLDLDGIERAITGRTRIVLINTPHNPSGRIYPEELLQRLADILDRATDRNGRRVYLVSDEAYARILFDGRRMVTPARFYGATFMLHTYSKTLLAPSQRAGYLAMPPDMPDRERLRQRLLWATLQGGSAPDTVMQHAMPELEALSIDVAAIQRRRDLLITELRRAGYSVETPEGGFYLFPKTPIPDAIEFCDWLAERRVYTLPGEVFERPGHFRLSLTASDAMVERALPHLREAMATFVPAGG
jgi:aspartate aminotransferase